MSSGKRKTPPADAVPRRRQMSMVKRSVCYPASMYAIVDHQLRFLIREVGEHLSVQRLEKIRSHLDWAKKKHLPLVPFVIFWWLYTTWDIFKQMLNDIERSFDPGISDERLADIRRYVKRAVDDVKTTAYDATSAPYVMRAFHQRMNLGINVGLPCLLEFKGFAAGSLETREGADEDVFALLPLRDKEFYVRVKRATEELAKRYEV